MRGEGSAEAIVSGRTAPRSTPSSAPHEPEKGIMSGSAFEQDLLEKLRDLPAEKLAEVEDFVDFLRRRDEERRLAEAAASLSEEAFRKVWDNPDDSAYDAL